MPFAASNAWAGIRSGGVKPRCRLREPVVGRGRIGICFHSRMEPNVFFLTSEVQAEIDAMGAAIRRMRIAADATQRELGDVAYLDQSTI